MGLKTLTQSINGGDDIVSINVLDSYELACHLYNFYAASNVTTLLQNTYVYIVFANVHLLFSFIVITL